MCVWACVGGVGVCVGGVCVEWRGGKGGGHQSGMAKGRGE